MSRASRQSKILSIIASRDIETQDELVAALQYAGYKVTQATISRDIKELGLIKTLTSVGKYKYVTKQKVDSNLSGKLLNIVRETVVSVVTASNLVVVKTMTDSAGAVSGAIEQLSMPEVVGVVADRSTILIVCRSARDADVLAQEVNGLLY
ncbi:MAG: hypothetical protein NC099_02420 [Corallococcus sp.]|nr:arginine repressor [Bacillota bacterium]MCM1533487.1 hypothetical protein [Corallococcus sp.]